MRKNVHVTVEISFVVWGPGFLTYLSNHGRRHFDGRQGDHMSFQKKSPKVKPNPFFVKFNA
jgi:hypothetical protein